MRRLPLAILGAAANARCPLALRDAWRTQFAASSTRTRPQLFPARRAGAAVRTFAGCWLRHWQFPNRHHRCGLFRFRHRAGPGGGKFRGGTVSARTGVLLAFGDISFASSQRTVRCRDVLRSVGAPGQPRGVSAGDSFLPAAARIYRAQRAESPALANFHRRAGLSAESLPALESGVVAGRDEGARIFGSVHGMRNVDGGVHRAANQQQAAHRPLTFAGAGIAKLVSRNPERSGAEGQAQRRAAVAAQPRSAVAGTGKTRAVLSHSAGRNSLCKMAQIRSFVSVLSGAAPGLTVRGPVLRKTAAGIRATQRFNRYLQS